MPRTYLIVATLSLLGSAPASRIVETAIGASVETIVGTLCADDLGRSALTSVHAVDLVEGGAGITTDVTAEVLAAVATTLNATNAELPRSLLEAFQRYAVPEPSSWIAEYRRVDREIERLCQLSAERLPSPIRLAA